MGLVFRPVEREGLNDDVILGLGAGADESVVSCVMFSFPCTMWSSPDPIQGSPTCQLLLCYTWKTYEIGHFFLVRFHACTPTPPSRQAFPMSSDALESYVDIFFQMWKASPEFPKVQSQRFINKDSTDVESYVL